MIRVALPVVALALSGCGQGEAGTAEAAMAGGIVCTVASVTDGDTLRCAERGQDGRPIRIRLSGINAREHDGTCNPGSPCPAASALSASAALASLVAGERLQCQPVGSTYGRIAAFCRRSSDGADISCAMLASGTVARWDRYWQGHRC